MRKLCSADSTMVILCYKSIGRFLIILPWFDEYLQTSTMITRTKWIIPRFDWVGLPVLLCYEFAILSIFISLFKFKYQKAIVYLPLFRIYSGLFSVAIYSTSSLNGIKVSRKMTMGGMTGKRKIRCRWGCTELKKHRKSLKNIFHDICKGSRYLFQIFRFRIT